MDFTDLDNYHYSFKEFLKDKFEYNYEEYNWEKRFRLIKNFYNEYEIYCNDNGFYIDKRSELYEDIFYRFC